MMMMKRNQANQSFHNINSPAILCRIIENEGDSKEIKKDNKDIFCYYNKENKDNLQKL